MFICVKYVTHLSTGYVRNFFQKYQNCTSADHSSFIPLAYAECNDSLPFSGASSIPLCYVHFPATFLHQLFFHPLSPHLAIYFLVYLSILFFPNSYIIFFWEFYFLPFYTYCYVNDKCRPDAVYSFSTASIPQRSAPQLVPTTSSRTRTTHQMQ